MNKISRKQLGSMLLKRHKELIEDLNQLYCEQCNSILTDKKETHTHYQDFINSLLNLQKLVEAISEVWTYDKRFVTMQVLLQNMAHHTKDKEEPESFFQPYLKVLELFKVQSPSCHVSSWVYDEADNIIMSYYNQKFYENVAPDVD